MRVLGIDYGARRIGMALSDATATLASPWRLVQRPPSDAETLRLLVREISTTARSQKSFFWLWLDSRARRSPVWPT